MHPAAHLEVGVKEEVVLGRLHGVKEAQGDGRARRQRHDALESPVRFAALAATSEARAALFEERERGRAVREGRELERPAPPLLVPRRVGVVGHKLEELGEVDLAEGRRAGVERELRAELVKLRRPPVHGDDDVKVRLDAVHDGSHGVAEGVDAQQQRVRQAPPRFDALPRAPLGVRFKLPEQRRVLCPPQVRGHGPRRVAVLQPQGLEEKLGRAARRQRLNTGIDLIFSAPKGQRHGRKPRCRYRWCWGMCVGTYWGMWCCCKD